MGYGGGGGGGGGSGGSGGGRVGGGAAGYGAGGSGAGGASGYRRVGDDRTANLKVNNITNKDGSSGTEVDGIVEVNTTAHFIPPSGRTGQRYVDGGENIVRNGLVFHLDAKYSLDGLWYDMSGSESHGELTGIAQYDPTAGGNVLFDSANDRVNLDVHTFKYAAPLTAGYSFEVWMRILSHPSTGYNGIFGIGPRTDPGGGTKLLLNTFLHGGGTQNRHFTFASSLSGSNGRGVNMKDPTICPLNEWINYQGTVVPGNYNTSALILYKNGVEVAKNAPLTPSNSQGTGSLFDITTLSDSKIMGMSIGYDARYNAGSDTRRMHGNVAVAKLYNRVLTAEEVLQNYNALKFRFGH